jgi:hypothetical protein
MDNRLNLLAALSSILSIVIAALPAFVSQGFAAYLQSGFALVLVIVLAFLFFWLKKYERSSRASIKKEDLILVARQQIESASKKVVLFSNDLSWVHDYAEVIRGRVAENCQVIVLHKKSEIEKVIQNANILRSMGVTVVELDDDHKLRATLIDPDDASTARLFVAHKRVVLQPP